MPRAAARRPCGADVRAAARPRPGARRLCAGGARARRQPVRRPPWHRSLRRQSAHGGKGVGRGPDPHQPAAQA
eukprot:249286-Prymnesium_polylepis.1